MERILGLLAVIGFFAWRMYTETEQNKAAERQVSQKKKEPEAAAPKPAAVALTPAPKPEPTPAPEAPKASAPAPVAAERTETATETPAKKPAARKAAPKVTAEKAVTADAIACLMCGKEVKLLKSHLIRSHKTDWEAYRKAFNLPEDYPVIAATQGPKKTARGIRTKPGNK